MNKRLLFNIINIISIIISLILFIFIIRLDLLPLVYVLLIFGILVVFSILNTLFINNKRVIFNIIGFILIVCISFISFIGIYYINKTDVFLDKIFSSTNYSTTTYYIVSNGDYNEEDINSDIYYYSNTDINSVKKYLSDTFDLNYIECDSLISLFKDISNGTKRFMIIDKSTYNIVFDLDKSINTNNYKIIFSFDISKKIDSSNKNTLNKFNLLIVGSDFASFNDLNLLVTVNLDKQDVLVTTIPRNYYIPVYGDGRPDILSFMAPYGIDVTEKSIEEYFNINIDYYLKINTHSIVKLVDEIGGITYCSDQAFYTTHSLVLDTYVDNKGKFYVKKGCQDVNGIETLTIARERLAFYDGDRTRQKNVVKIIQAIIDKMVSSNTLGYYENILNSMSDLYETNIPKEEISLIVKKVISNGWNKKLKMQSVDGYETKDYVHLSDYIDYVIVPYDNTVVDAVTNINNLLDKK